MSNEAAITINVERVLKMGEREIYDLADHYVKGRLGRFAIDLDTQKVLEQRDLHPSDRDPRYDEMFDSVRTSVHDVLYDPQILPLYRLALAQTVRAVEKQLGEYSENESWRRGATGFMTLVQDELARADAILNQQEEESAKRQLTILLSAIDSHEAAEDADEADDRLYAIAAQVRAETAPQSGSEDLISA